MLDRNNQTFELISHVPGNPAQSNDRDAVGHHLSPDGRYVVYTGAVGAAYRYDRATDQEVLLTLSLDGNQPLAAGDLRVSDDAATILFSSSSSSVAPFDPGLEDAFLARVIALFADGFESGTTDAWSNATP